MNSIQAVAGWAILALCINAFAGEVKIDGEATEHSEQSLATLLQREDIRGVDAPKLMESPKAHVVMIAGVQCPFVRRYLPRLLKLEAAYRKKGVQFYLVYSQLGEKRSEVLKVAEGKHELQPTPIPFRVLFDQDQAIINRLNANVLSQTFVLTPDYKVVYRGKFDNGLTIPDNKTTQDRVVSRAYAEEALSLSLRGFGASDPATEAEGCEINRPREVNEAIGITYNRDIAPIFRRTCEKCHSAGEIKEDVPLNTYDDLTVWLDTIADRVARRQMPPYNVDKRIAERVEGYKTDKSLTDDEIHKIIAWVESGAPEGSGSPPPPRKTKQQLWHLGRPDVILSFEKPFAVKADGYINYQYSNAREVAVDEQGQPIMKAGAFQTKTFNYKTDRDLWMKWAEVIPGAPTTVHHVVVTVKETKRGLYLVEPASMVVPYEKDPLGSPIIKTLAKRFGASLGTQGSLLGLARTYGVKGTKSMSYVAAYAPGEAVIEWDNIDSSFIPAGSEIMIEMHYTPDGQKRYDQTLVGLKFAEQPAKNQMLSMALGKTISMKMEPNSTKLYKKEFTFRHKAKILMFRPHAHLRGLDFLYEVHYPAVISDFSAEKKAELWPIYQRFFDAPALELVEKLSDPTLSRRARQRLGNEGVDAGTLVEHENEEGELLYFLPSQAILRIPHFDFFNQPYYSFKKPIVVPKGAKIEVTSNFDNSPTNPALTESQYNSTAKYGIHTDQLMFFGYLNFVYLEGDPEGKAPNNWGWWIDFVEYE